MHYSLDQTSDYSYKELYSYLNINSVPDFVKQAECMTKASAGTLPDEAFADKYHRAFPISSAPDVYISNAYFVNKKAELSKLWGDNYVGEVEGRITKAAELFNIKGDLVTYSAKLMEKEAADYSENVIASFDIGGTSYDLFPYKTAEDIKYQAAVFAGNIKNYPFTWRPKIAHSFIEKAAEIGINELPDIICKYGGMFFPDVREFQNTLARRMRKLGEDYQSKYQPILEKAAEVSSREDAMNICAEAYKIEKESGIYEKPLVYREMGDIVDRTMILGMDKLANLMNVVKMNNDYYNISDLQKISKDIYKQAFGCDIDPANINELREVLPTIPGSDVALLRELSGIQSVN
jgi:hypothetical protein